MKDIFIFFLYFFTLKALTPNSQTKSYALFASFERKGVKNSRKKKEIEDFERGEL